MRGRKTELWEGGHRVPCFIRWPDGNLAKPQDIGGLTQVQDILPTLLELSGIKSESGPEFDGISLASILRGEQHVPDDRILIINYSRMPGFANYPSPYSQTQMRADQAGVLWKRWRLLEDRELYNLETDPFQQTNIIDQHPEVVVKLRKQLTEWWDRVGATATKNNASSLEQSMRTLPNYLPPNGWMSSWTSKDRFLEASRKVDTG